MTANIADEEQAPTRNVNSKMEIMHNAAESSTKSPKNQMETLGNETASKQNVKNPLIISHGQTLSMTNVTP